MNYTNADFIRDLKADLTDARNNSAKKKIIHNLMDKYGETREEIENNSTITDWMEFKLANGDVLLDEVRRERARRRQISNPYQSVFQTSAPRLPAAQKPELFEDEDEDKPQEQETYHNTETPITKQSEDEPSKIQQAKTALADLGYYRGKIDNLATPGLTKAMNDFAEDHQINEQNLSERLDKITEKLKSVKTPARLDFDGKYLRFIQDGKLLLVLNAMSGTPDHQNRKYQNVRDKGPLPEGSYRVKQNRIQDINLWQGVGGAIIKITPWKLGEAYGGYPAWGKTRVWLEPFSSNNMYGRDKFTIHGGADLGSAGCIDIPGHTKEFFDLLRKHGRDIILNVHYDNEKLQ